MKKNYFWVSLSFCLSILLLIACNNSQPQTAPHEAEATTLPSESTPAAPEAALAEQELVFSWVQNLNIRESPNTTAKVVAQAGENDPLIYTGEKTDHTEEITLRGATYNEPWIKVITADKKSGWVFRGAVKRKGENKGTALVSENAINFPHFGQFDLKEWKEISKSDGSGGDAESWKTTYSSNKQILEISKTDVGEYGYSRKQKLMDQNGNLLKLRELEFEIDPAFVLTEKVYDLQSNPARLYTRSQQFKVHFMQLTPRPEAATGDFKITNLSPAEVKTIKAKNVVIQSFGYHEWPKAVGGDSGCSCSFRPDKDNYKLDVFATNLGDKACVKLNGKMLLLTGGRTDNRMEVIERANTPHWMVLNEKGTDLIFGKDLDPNKYTEKRYLLVQTLLVMDKWPDEIPIKMNGTVGMGYRAEIRDMCQEAFKMAKDLRSNGDKGTPVEMRYKNEEYECYINAEVVGKNDGGGDTLHGKLIINSKDGTYLAEQEIWGTCGC